MNIDEIRIVEKEMVRLLPIFLKEMVDYVSVNRRMYIMDRIMQNRANQLINFGNGIGAWCIENTIYFAVQNKDMFRKFVKNPEYGQNKDLVLIGDDDDFIDNDKDYVDYMEYVVSKGLTELEYCLDLLPHQIMHLIGANGGVLGEGITELRTRQICKKYGIRCAPILHSKETKIAKMLEDFVGEMMLNEAVFWGDYTVLEEELESIFGVDEFRPIYEDLCIDYRTYASDRTVDPFVHYKKYREIDFSRMIDLIESKQELKLK